MSAEAKDVAKNKKTEQQAQQQPQTKKKERVRDVRLDERDAQIKAWKASGKSGIPDSVKRDDFKRVAQRRLDGALEALRLLKQSGRRSAYSYTDDQAASLIGAIKAEVDDLERAFAPVGADANKVVL